MEDHNNISFQYISDIHINQNNICENNIHLYIKPTAENLLIAGDIGNPFLDEYLGVLRWCSDNFKNTYIIAGNHEYYCGQPIKEVDEQINKMCNSLENVYFLNNETKYLVNICIIGTILWSNIDLKYSNEIRRNVNNFKLIKNNNGNNITPFSIKNVYEKNRKWLESEIQRLSQMDNKKIIILTHYPPMMCFRKSIKKNDKLKTAYCNSLETMINRMNSSVCLWVCGHTHYNNTVTYNNIFIVSNCVGYIKNNNQIHKNNAVYYIN